MPNVKAALPPPNLATGPPKVCGLSSLRAGNLVPEEDLHEVLHARRPLRSETLASSDERELPEPDEHEHDEPPQDLLSKLQGVCEEEEKFIAWYDSYAQAGVLILTILSVGLALIRMDHAFHCLLAASAIAIGLLELLAERPDCPRAALVVSRYAPKQLDFISLGILGMVVYTASLPAEQAAEEVAMQLARHLQNQIWLPTGFLVAGYVFGTRAVRRRRSMTFIYLAMFIREAQVVWVADSSIRMEVLRTTWFTWFQPSFLGMVLALPGAGLARRLWTAQFRLQTDVENLHSHVAILEATRKERLMQKVIGGGGGAKSNLCGSGGSHASKSAVRRAASPAVAARLLPIREMTGSEQRAARRRTRTGSGKEWSEA